MAELGVAASVIELVNAGFALGKFLDDTYHDYKNAPTEVLEIATEVNICCELMQPLGEQLKAGSVRYTRRFETSVQALVDNSTTTFDNIRDLIPRNKDGSLDRGIVPKWTYVLNKRKISKHRRRLTEIRQMFLFIKQAMNEAQPSVSAHTAGGASKDPPKLDPITLTGPGRDASGNPVHFSATLVMHPIQAQTFSQVTEKAESRGSQQRPRRPEGYLRSLRQNPYFAPDLLKPSRQSFSGEASYDPTGGSGSLRYSDRYEDQDDYDYEEKRLREAYERQRIKDEVMRKEDRIPQARLEKEEQEDVVAIPDDIEATQEVEALVNSWFGPEPEQRRPHQPSVTVTDTSRPPYESSRANPRYPAAEITSPGSSRAPSARAPSPRGSPSAGYYPSSSPSSFRCNDCDRTIRGTRFECQRCENYDLCSDCFYDPDTSVRLHHRHPMSEFMAIR